MHLTPNSCVVSLLKIQNVWRPALVKLDNFYKNKCEIPLFSGTLGR